MTTENYVGIMPEQKEHKSQRDDK